MRLRLPAVATDPPARSPSSRFDGAHGGVGGDCVRPVYWPRVAGTGAGTGTGNGALPAPAADGAGGTLPGRVDTPIYDGHRPVPCNGL